MAKTLRKQISRAIANAIRARDRAEMRAMDAVLSLVESPQKKTRRPPPKGAQGHRRRTTRVRPPKTSH